MIFLFEYYPIIINTTGTVNLNFFVANVFPQWYFSDRLYFRIGLFYIYAPNSTEVLTICTNIIFNGTIPVCYRYRNSLVFLKFSGIPRYFDKQFYKLYCDDHFIN